MAQQPELDHGEDAALHPAQATGRGRVAGRRVQRTVNFDQEVLDRARAAAAHLAAHAPEAGVRSLADIINPAVKATMQDTHSTDPAPTEKTATAVP